MREKIRVTKRGGTVSAIACFCHSGNLPQYNGRFRPKNSHRLDELALKFTRTFRITIRPQLLGIDHSVLSLDILWHFQDAGLKDVQINGHLSLVSPGDARIPIEEGAAYAIERHQNDLKNLIDMREKHGEQLAIDGFSETEYDEFIELRQEHLDYLKADHSRVREMMEVFTNPVMIIRGKRPLIDY